jgi:aerobic carbon-monoxide dehydrogenase large subunit
VPSTSFMGATVRRREDPRLITGSATYVDDIALTNMAHMAVLRSPHPHARIVGINVAEALAQPGVLAAATGEDVKHLIPPQQGEQQGEAGPSARPPLAVGVVRYIGDPVVAIVATDVALAFDALEYVDIEYEQLEGIGDVEKALLPGAPQIDAASPGNVAERREHKAGDTDKAFADADVIASVRMVSQRLSPNPMEPRGVVAQYEGGSGEVTVYSSTQCAHFVRDALCEAFQVPQTKMRVIAPEVGGGFGCKGGAYGEDVLAVHFARALQRPIKWIETRSEHIQSTVHGRAQVAYVDLAAKNDGRIIGLRLRLILDSGAYPAPWLAMITAGMVTGCYHIPNLSSESITVLTNKTPLGAYRGAGRPEAAFYIERAMDVLAGKLGIDPAEIRRRNFVPPDAFPYQLPDWPAFDVVSMPRRWILRSSRATMKSSGTHRRSCVTRAV